MCGSCLRDLRHVTGSDAITRSDVSHVTGSDVTGSDVIFPALFSYYSSTKCPLIRKTKGCYRNIQKP